MEFPKVVFIQKPAKGKDEHVVAISLTKKKFHPNEEVCHTVGICITLNASFFSYHDARHPIPS